MNRKKKFLGTRKQGVFKGYFLAIFYCFHLFFKIIIQTHKL